MTQHKSDKKLTFAEKVAESISKNRIALWIILIVLVVLTVVFAVVDKNIKDTNNMYSNKAVELQKEFQDWFSAQEEDKEAAEKAFLENVNPIADSEKTSILVEKALFIRGQFYMQKEEWSNADADFSRIAEI
ncbi:MAG: hypothetical protein JEY91_07440 [Spirochaetaceae bacterium]|nr:hypothetical protein [Spirochaetaceae bacterium]